MDDLSPEDISLSDETCVQLQVTLHWKNCSAACEDAIYLLSKVTNDFPVAQDDLDPELLPSGKIREQLYHDVE